MKKPAPSLKVLVLRHFLLYTADVSLAIAGFHFGWGLHVKNWWALIGIFIISRMFFFTISTAWIQKDALSRMQHGEK